MRVDKKWLTCEEIASTEAINSDDNGFGLGFLDPGNWTNQDLQPVLNQAFPSAFRWRYQNVFPLTLKLKFRNGYELWVDRLCGILKDTRILLRDFNLEGGEVLLLEYCGNFDFVVYVIGLDGCELNYPRVLHEF
ncbi:hypothetical protein POM88_008407 [Heracleum sosnowskyi]|uniref:Uncharacterized protein n=1 Tax=Heracleum sosnowskyi TaxID=360622 RepID=A0AAD8J6L4_9APIA|nr:hypothetical protein POM88_008407 [Heracleum sosnowskyi]